MLLVMGHTGGSKRHARDPQAGNAGEGGHTVSGGLRPWSFLLQLGLCPRPSVTRTPQSGHLDHWTPPQHSCLSFPLVPATPSPLAPSHMARVLPLPSGPPQDSSGRALLSWHRNEGLPGCRCHCQDPTGGQEGPIPLCRWDAPGPEACSAPPEATWQG